VATNIQNTAVAAKIDAQTNGQAARARMDKSFSSIAPLIFPAGLPFARLRTTHPRADENTIFSMALPWLPSVFLVCGILLWSALRLTLRRRVVPSDSAV
jgi:hypothetical protein